MADDKTTVLFLCTGNSARSILAEAIANQQFGKHLRAFSAGSDPGPAPHPLALETLARHELSVEGLTSKSWDRLAGERFDAVITLCDSARDGACPDFPGSPLRAHWPLPDPPAAEHPEAAFEGVFDTLNEAIGLLVHAPDPELASRLREASRQVCLRQAPRAA